MPNYLCIAVVCLLASSDLAAQIFVRYGEIGAEQPGLVDENGQLRSLHGHIDDILPATLEHLTTLTDLDAATLPLVKGQPRIGAPISGSRKIIAAGFNYSDHARETNTPIPEEPLLFSKSATALSGPFDPIITPRGSTELDYEAELVIVIGRLARYVSEVDALAHIAGFATGNDVSERSFQTKRGGQFVKGKSADSFAKVGPYLVTPDSLENVQDLSISTLVNGEPRQNSNTRYMIFSAAYLVSYISQFMTLEPGDLIFTGTPSGVGSARTPAVFLKPGDVVEIEISGLGAQRHSVAPASQPANP